VQLLPQQITSFLDSALPSLDDIAICQKTNVFPVATTPPRTLGEEEMKGMWDLYELFCKVELDRESKQ
jgi:hypothetical protein